MLMAILTELQRPVSSGCSYNKPLLTVADLSEIVNYV